MRHFHPYGGAACSLAHGTGFAVRIMKVGRILEADDGRYAQRQRSHNVALTFCGALRLGHNHVDTKRILLAPMDQENGDSVLAAADLDVPAAESFVTTELLRERAIRDQLAAIRA